MRSLHIRTKKQPEGKRGLQRIVRPGTPHLKHITFGVARLAEKKGFSEATGEYEVVVDVLAGRVRVSTEGMREVIGGRANVFAGPAAAAYIPAGRKYRVTAVGGPAEVAVARARARPGKEAAPFVVRPEDVKVSTRGRENWTREIHDIIDASRPATRMLFGETFNPPGNWSSYPPHRHEKDEGTEEVELEELYYFRLEPPQGFGIQRIYTDDRSIDAAYVLEDGDITIMPRGYHPVVTAPGYRLCYLWILAGERREMLPRDDPAHKWVAQTP